VDTNGGSYAAPPGFYPHPSRIFIKEIPSLIRKGISEFFGTTGFLAGCWQELR
jgi:hypothetical protein